MYQLKLKIISQRELESVIDKIPFSQIKEYALIRISSTQFHILNESAEQKLDILHDLGQLAYFTFHDITHEQATEQYIKALKNNEKYFLGLNRKTILFTHDDLKEIINFANNMKDRGINKYIIHCDEGKGRSPAVAVIVAETYDEPEIGDAIRKSFANSINYYILDMWDNYKLQETQKCSKPRCLRI